MSKALWEGLMLTIFAAFFGALIEDKKALACLFVLGLLIAAVGRVLADMREREEMRNKADFDAKMERARKTQGLPPK
jgi:fructose-specific phosphotransferase system IIC component